MFLVGTIIAYAIVLSAIRLAADFMLGGTFLEKAALQDTFGLVLTVVILLEFIHSIFVAATEASGAIQTRPVILIAMLVAVSRFGFVQGVSASSMPDPRVNPARRVASLIKSNSLIGNVLAISGPGMLTWTDARLQQASVVAMTRRKFGSTALVRPRPASRDSPADRRFRCWRRQLSRSPGVRRDVPPRARGARLDRRREYSRPLSLTGGDGKQLRANTANLVGLASEVILSGGTPVTTDLKEETQTIPIVFMHVADPLSGGLVQSLAHPGGNITGFTAYESSICGKGLQLLRELVPRLNQVLVLVDAMNPSWRFHLPTIEAAAPAAQSSQGCADA
jgi:hypothetical protein